MALKSSAVKSANTTFKYSTGPVGTPPVITYTKLGEVTSIPTGPSQSVTQNDVTNMDSEAFEFVPGLVNNGSISLDINYVPGDAGLGVLHTALEAGTTLYGQIDGPSHDWTFLFNVENINFTPAGPDGVYKGSLTLRITGKVTRT